MTLANVPSGLLDLGLTAVALFLFVSAIYLILRIVQAVKNKGVDNGNGKRVSCLQSPQLQGILTNQALTMETVRKIEEGGDEIKQNMILQTKLMEQMGHVLERLSDCAIRQEATERMRRG